ncbi:MAG TPA: hypothetical protein VKD43_08595 [Xanthobacteraceae bacterium]|nr:hypothetical protein [Xanthobacteraceae bacterium]
MSAPELLLVAWWLLTIALILSGFFLAKLQRALNRKAAATIALEGSWTGHRAPAMRASALPRAVGVAAVILIFVWFAGLVTFIWMVYWTRLLLLNSQLLMVLFGAGVLVVGLSHRLSAIAVYDPTWLPPALVRPLMILVGLVLIPLGSYWVIGDLAFPRSIVHGRVSSVSHSGSELDTFSIVIDDKRYDTLRDVFLAVSEGDAVRAEVGAASKTILRVERTRPQ